MLINLFILFDGMDLCFRIVVVSDHRFHLPPLVGAEAVYSELTAIPGSCACPLEAMLTEPICMFLLTTTALQTLCIGALAGVPCYGQLVGEGCLLLCT